MELFLQTYRAIRNDTFYSAQRYRGIEFVFFVPERRRGSQDDDPHYVSRNGLSGCSGTSKNACDAKNSRRAHESFPRALEECLAGLRGSPGKAERRFRSKENHVGKEFDFGGRG